MKSRDLLYYLKLYFHDWMGAQRNASPHTISSYRDAWRLLLQSIASRQRCATENIQLLDITADNVLAFLEDVEKVRECSISTRNNRLAAIKSFSKFFIRREPTLSFQFGEILDIPTKRGARREVSYLDTVEMKAILAQPDTSKPEGFRDLVLLSFLFSTGARIQEALDVTPADIRWTSPQHVKLMGKGRKQRITPLTSTPVRLLQRMLKGRAADPGPIFRNRYGAPLNATGVRFKLKQYVKAAELIEPTLKDKRVSPHTIRHATGVALVSANTDETTIRNIFGHASIETTSLYARADLRTKRRALEKFDPFNKTKVVPAWQDQPAILKFLDSL